MALFYAGIGSRQTPANVTEKMRKMSRFLSARGFVLRSGGALGADQAFQEGSKMSIIFRAKDATEQSRSVARRFHPNFDKLSEVPRNLISRNALIILGENLNSPVSFVVCWTPGGEAVGGTGHSIRIAKSKGIPVFNLAKSEDESNLKLFVGNLMVEESLKKQSLLVDERDDGVGHINVYSKASTQLGRFLSNFYECRIKTEIGDFSSIEGLWFYLSTSHKEKEKLRHLSGSEAKVYGARLKRESYRYDPRFNEIICDAITNKIVSNPKFALELSNSTLPLTHYYIFDSKKKVPEKHFWVIHHIEMIRIRLKVQKVSLKWIQYINFKGGSCEKTQKSA